MISVIARTCAASLALISTLTTAHGAGNSRLNPIGKFDNWAVEEHNTLPEFKENISDVFLVIGNSTIPGISIEFHCITRSVVPDVPQYSINIHRGDVDTSSKFDVMISSSSAQFKLLMLALPEQQSYSLRLRSNTFENIFRSFAADQA
jgi:hypothetical protein